MAGSQCISNNFCANISDDSSLTSEFWEAEDKTSAWVSSAFLLLFVVVGLPWNLLVIVTIVRQKLYTQPTILLLLILALNDALWCIVFMPFRLAVGIRGEFFFGGSDRVRCMNCGLGVLPTFFAYTSLFTILVMTLDRFLFIYRPLLYERVVTSGRMLLVMAALCIVAIVISILPLANFGQVTFCELFLFCYTLDFNNTSYFVFLVVMTAIPTILVIFFNVLLCCIVSKNIKAVYNVRSHDASGDFYSKMKKKRHQKQRHMIEVFGALLITYVLSWFLMVLVICITLSGTPVPRAFALVAHIVYLSQVAVHPILQTVLIKEVRVPISRVCSCYCKGVEVKSSSSCGAMYEGYGRGCNFLKVCNIALYHFQDSHNSSTSSHQVEVAETNMSTVASP